MAVAGYSIFRGRKHKVNGAFLGVSGMSASLWVVHGGPESTRADDGAEESARSC